MKLIRFIQPLYFAVLIFFGFWFIADPIIGMLLLMGVIFSCKSLFSKKIWQHYSLSPLMLIYLIWLFVVAYISNVPHASMMELAVLAGLPIVYLMATNTQHFTETWKILRIGLFLMAVGFGLWAIYQVYTHTGFRNHAVGPLHDRNAFAATLNLLWFPAVYLFITNKFSSNRLAPVLFGFGIFIISTALFATTSRGGIGTWVLLLPFVLWAAFKHTQSKQHIAAILLLAIFAYGCSSLLLNNSIADRTFQLAQDPSVSGRLLMWKSTIAMILDNPLIGTGWGTFSNYYPAHRFPAENITAGFFAHNDYLQLASEGGVPALLLQLGLLIGILLQLGKSLKQANNVAGLESVFLLLGVLAIYIHATVNFIFYFAFMNILAGLYLARIAQLNETPKYLALPRFEYIRPSVKRLLSGFVVLLVAAPFAINLISVFCLTGTHKGIKVINLIAPDVTAFQVANVITTFRPQDGIAQEFILQTFEGLLAEPDTRLQANESVKRELLTESIKHFELVRTQNANDASTGLREAVVLIEQHSLMQGDLAYIRAHQILAENLEVNPFHTGSSLQLATLQNSRGQQAEALHTLERAKLYVREHGDAQLIKIHTLRILAAPEKVIELDDMEKQIRSVLKASAKGLSSGMVQSESKHIDEKLAIIAGQIQQ